MAWNEAVFSGEPLFQNEFSISIRFTLVHLGESWILNNTYEPCHAKNLTTFID